MNRRTFLISSASGALVFGPARVARGPQRLAALRLAISAAVALMQKL